jgi:alpha-mannosidase
LLVAAVGDTTNQIKIGDSVQTMIVPNWTGYIGQWDNRVWDNPNHTQDFESSKPPVGLIPGYIKRTPVAWFATHHNTPKGDAFYNYSYLFQVSYDLPAGATSLTLPDDAKVRVFAVSVGHEVSPTPPAAPLYDTLSDHQTGGAPIIPQAGQTFTEMTPVTLIPPLYHRPGDLHYTVDGSDPTASSPVYSQPFLAEQTVNIAVAQIDKSGNVGPITRGAIEINDHSAPILLSALAGKDAASVNLVFNKPLDSATATDAQNYKVEPALAIGKVSPSDDGRSITVTFADPIPAGTEYTLSLSGLKDRTPFSNVIVPTAKKFNSQNIVYTLKSAQLPAQNVKTAVAGLPLQDSDAWTMNVLVKPSKKPDDRTIIAGFGGDSDGKEGASRYFAVFDDSIRFWSADRDVTTGSPLEVGRWQMLTVTYDGKTLAIYKDGDPIGKDDVELSTDPDANVCVGTTDPWDHTRSYSGELQSFTIRRGALSGPEVRQLFETTKPD